MEDCKLDVRRVNLGSMSYTYLFIDVGKYIVLLISSIGMGGVGIGVLKEKVEGWRGIYKSWSSFWF